MNSANCVTLRPPWVQAELAHAILATGRPLVLVLVNGRPYAIPGLDQQTHAILEAWLREEEGGAAVAEVLFGQRIRAASCRRHSHFMWAAKISASAASSRS